MESISAIKNKKEKKPRFSYEEVRKRKLSSIYSKAQVIGQNEGKLLEEEIPLEAGRRGICETEKLLLPKKAGDTTSAIHTNEINK